MKIVELDHKLLVGAIEANEQSFSGTDLARRSLTASLDPETAKQFVDMQHVLFRKFWVAIDAQNIVHGTIGIYTQVEDEAEADWINWYCVRPSSRGQGLGRQLLEFIIIRALERSKPWLRLWTTNGPNEQAAQPLYEKLGFAIYKSEPADDPTCSQIIYRQRIMG